MNWPAKLLGDLVDIKGGGTPSKSVPEYWGGTIPWASVKDFKGENLEKTEDYITELAVKGSSTNVIPAGSIIVPTRMALGKVAINAVDMAINQDLKALRVRDESKLFFGYLFRFLESKAQHLEAQGKGATVKGITLDVLRDLEVPLPPLPEQKRIAAILDKADAIRRKRQQAIQLADDFLRAVFLDMFGDPVTNPKGWSVKPLGQISFFENGDRSSNYPSGDDLVSEGVLFLSTKNIVSDILNLESCQYITEEKYTTLSRGKAQKGDLIITLRGTLGACCVFDCEHEKAFINAQMMIIRPGSDVSSIFLHDLLTSKGVKKHLQSIGRGAAVPQLTAKQLRELMLPLPPIEEQEVYENIRKSVLEIIKKTQSGLEVDLMNSISKQAFRGEL